MGKTLLNSGQSRVFLQKDGPGSAFLYYDCLALTGLTQDMGTPDPVYCPSSTKRDAWEIVGRVPKAQALGTADFNTHVDRFLREAWLDVIEAGCDVNLAIVNGACQNPADFTKWDSILLLLASRVTTLGFGDFNVPNPDDNTVIDLTGSISFERLARIKKIVFGAVAETECTCEVLDALFHDVASCGECGTPSAGCNKVYALQTACTGSPGLSSAILYSLDEGLVWAVLDIPPLGGLAANRMAAVGERLVVVSQNAGAHVWQDFSGVDAGLTTGWTKVTSGYVAGKSPRAIYSKSPSETFVAGAGGYVYFMSDPSVAVTVLTDGSVTTQQLNDIHGYGNTVVAVGGSNAVLASTNVGSTWTLITGPTVGVSLAAIWCITDQLWYVGTGDGRLYRTLNGGTTWTQVALPAGITVIDDVQFTPGGAVGYLAGEVAGAARVYRSVDGGYSWHYSDPAITGLPAAVRVNVVVPCGFNEVIAGGRKTVGGDGVIAIAR